MPVFRHAVPEDWNGTLLVYSSPVPVAVGDPPWRKDDPLIGALTAHGYAVTGVANTIFWPLESVFAAVPELLEEFADAVGRPDRTVGLGQSIGGLIVAGLVQRSHGMLAGALAMCGNLAGAVATHNRELDIAFVVRALLAGDRGLEIASISDPSDNVRTARRILVEAQRTATGRARLALAAAVGNIPGWFDPVSPRPRPEQHLPRLHNQAAWFDQPGFLVYFGARSQVEHQAGGNPSWNTGVDYAERLEASPSVDLVEALYADADVALRDDLDALAAAARIDADAAAVAYLEDHIVLDGQLHGTPFLTLHTVGDGLVTVDSEHAYLDVVSWAGDHELLRQLYVDRAGHCSFTVAEVLTALEVLLRRLTDRAWPPLDPGSLRTRTAARAEATHALVSGDRVSPRFVDYEPAAFPRPYDIRG